MMSSLVTTPMFHILSKPSFAVHGRNKSIDSVRLWSTHTAKQYNMNRELKAR